MKKEYKLASSISGGLYETYQSFEEAKERAIYIYEHKEEFKGNRMIFVNEYEYNENGQIQNSRLLCTIEF